MKPGDLVAHKYTHDMYINVERDPLYRGRVNTIVWEYKRVGIVVYVGTRDHSVMKWIGILTPNGIGYCYEDRIRRV